MNKDSLKRMLVLSKNLAENIGYIGTSSEPPDIFANGSELLKLFDEYEKTTYFEQTETRQEALLLRSIFGVVVGGYSDEELKNMVGKLLAPEGMNITTVTQLSDIIEVKKEKDEEE